MLHNPNLFHPPSSILHPPPITPIFKKIARKTIGEFSWTLNLAKKEKNDGKFGMPCDSSISGNKSNENPKDKQE